MQGGGREAAGRMVVLGSLNSDLAVTLPHLPERGETVMGDRLRTFPGGKGANQAVAAARLGGEVAIITLGKAGAVLCQACGVTRLKPFTVDAVDATAAGDAFVGALAVALARGVNPAVAGRLAGAAGAAAATRYGAQSSLPRPRTCGASLASTGAGRLKARLLEG